MDLFRFTVAPSIMASIRMGNCSALDYAHGTRLCHCHRELMTLTLLALTRLVRLANATTALSLATSISFGAQVPGSAGVTVAPAEAARFNLESALHALESNHDVHFRNVWTTLGFLLLGIGWLVTSESVRSYVASHRRFRLAAMSFLAFAAICHAFMIHHQYAISKTLTYLVVSNVYAKAVVLSPAIYHSSMLSLEIAILSFALDEALFIILLLMIASVASRQPSPALSRAADAAYRRCYALYLGPCAGRIKATESAMWNLTSDRGDFQPHPTSPAAPPAPRSRR
jgi:hypothetical protein